WGGGSVVDGSGRRQVRFASQYKPGQLVVSFGDRYLYYVVRPGEAIGYPIATPREQSRWQGVMTVTQKRVNPSWTPTSEMRAENPRLPSWVPGGHPMNPLGVRALYLGSSTYRIHGTDAPWTIGQPVSKGCIRMYNKDVVDLYDRVPVGAQVIVTWQRFHGSGGDAIAAASGDVDPSGGSRRSGRTSKSGERRADVERAAPPASGRPRAKPESGATKAASAPGAAETRTEEPRRPRSSSQQAARSGDKQKAPAKKAADVARAPAAEPVEEPKPGAVQQARVEDGERTGEPAEPRTARVETVPAEGAASAEAARAAGAEETKIAEQRQRKRPRYRTARAEKAETQTEAVRAAGAEETKIAEQRQRKRPRYRTARAEKAETQVDGAGADASPGAVAEKHAAKPKTRRRPGARTTRTMKGKGRGRPPSTEDGSSFADTYFNGGVAKQAN
ncbi:MAG: L,D-transpeptidase family protein, partial [Hyphomicrobiaceae bacterium]